MITPDPNVIIAIAIALLSSMACIGMGVLLIYWIIKKFF
jgi:hypothetical protein